MKKSVVYAALQEADARGGDDAIQQYQRVEHPSRGRGRSTTSTATAKRWSRSTAATHKYARRRRASGAALPGGDGLHEKPAPAASRLPPGRITVEFDNGEATTAPSRTTSSRRSTRRGCACGTRNTGWAPSPSTSPTAAASCSSMRAREPTGRRRSGSCSQSTNGRAAQAGWTDSVDDLIENGARRCWRSRASRAWHGRERGRPRPGERVDRGDEGALAEMSSRSRFCSSSWRRRGARVGAPRARVGAPRPSTRSRTGEKSGSFLGGGGGGGSLKDIMESHGTTISQRRRRSKLKEEAPARSSSTRASGRPRRRSGRKVRARARTRARNGTQNLQRCLNCVCPQYLCLTQPCI